MLQLNRFTASKKTINKDSIELHLMILPAILYTIVFMYLPMIGLVIAFKDFNFVDGIFGSPWCGLKNFEFFFSSGKAFLVTKNTILYNIAFMVVNIFLEVLVAVILSEISAKRFKKIAQSVMILPHFISMVVVGIFAYSILDYNYGFLNSILKILGIPAAQLYNEPKAWKYIIVLVNAWKSVGYGSIVYLAAIMGLDRECYEAAAIDGANIWKKIRYITLPLLTPTIITMVLLAFGRLLRGNFELFYQLVGNNGTLFESTDIIDTLVFRSLISSSDLGMSSATGFYQSILCFIMIVGVNKIVKHVDENYALF